MAITGMDITGPAGATVSARYPADRLALLSTTRDAVMRGFFVLDAPAFEAMLDRLATDVFAPLPNAVERIRLDSDVFTGRINYRFGGPAVSRY